MYTTKEIREAVKNDALYEQGAALMNAGAVRRINWAEHKGYRRYFGVVREGGYDRIASFSYTPDDGRISGLTCDCGVNAHETCAHMAAVLFAVRERMALLEPTQQAQKARETSRLEWHKQRMEERRAQLRREQTEREQAERERHRRAVDRLIEAGRAGKPKQTAVQEKVRLYPLLSFCEDGMRLELRIGAKRPYVVRSIGEFAQRMTRRECTVYGKDLTFSHREEDVCQEDIALLWQIVSMGQALSGNEPLILTGAQLDQTMRLFIGREVDWRGENGRTKRMQVVSGSRELPVELTQEGEEYLLRVHAEGVVCGAAGAYVVLEEEGRVLCAFGQAYTAIGPLLALAREYPEGAPLADDQIGAACASLITPAGAAVSVVRGADIVRDNTPMAMTARFYIEAPERNALSCRVEYDYGVERLAPGEDNPHIRRDDDEEEAALAAAKALFPKKQTEAEWRFEGDDDACFALLSERLSELERFGEVMITPQLAQMNEKKPRAITFGVSASQAGELVVKADLGGFSQEDLQAAYSAYRLKKKYVRLTNGTFLSAGALEQAAQAAQVADGMDATAQELEAGKTVPASRALYLEAALKGRESIRLNAPKAITDFISRLQKAQKTRAAQPKTLKAELRDYQLEGLSWLTALCEANFGGILADDMGLGKTMQALALLLSCQERGEAVRALVVCPASLQLNWDNEADRFAPDLHACALMGDAAARRKAIAEPGDCALLITSYDQLRRDVQAYEGVTFTHVFLDEAQNIKNAASQAARAVKTIRAEHRFAMTGTPIENRLSELWSIFDFLMPGYLLSYKKFKEKFEAPVVREADEEARANLRALVAPFILRRMKADVLDDLPEKTEKLMTSEMTAEQKKLYHAHAAQLISQSEGGFADGQSRIRMLAGLTRLRQICCDPRLCVEAYSGGSGKLEQCVTLVRDMLARGHRVLLFSQFTSMLALLEEALQTQGISTFKLTGDTDKQERMELVERFNDGEAQVFLISLKAGGTGLNLTGANVVIHYDPWWNTSAQNQATDRAYRIGQKRGVQVFKLIAADTIEARILKLQQHKKELSDGVLMSDENLFTLDAEEMRELLRY